MPQIDLSILNQRQTPAFYADVLANRPAAGFIGRIFVSTNTFEFYRDNGTGWDLIGGPGAGTITGSGAAGQVTYWNGASTVTGDNGLFYDSLNDRLGIGTTTPGAAIDAHSTQSTILQLNQTAINDSRIAFQLSGAALWRIGNFYNGGANDFELFDVIGAQASITVKKTSGQVLIGTSTVGSGKLVVASATGDNGVQIVGASAPSLRIDNAASGPTKRAGLGISTAVNNFIQGSADRDFCIFNGSTAAASPILFGVYDTGLTNVQEAARISAARNFLVGTTTDAGQKLQVTGTGIISSTLDIGNATTYQRIANNGITAFSSGTYANTLNFGTSPGRMILTNNSTGTISFEFNTGSLKINNIQSGGVGGATFSQLAIQSNLFGISTVTPAITNQVFTNSGSGITVSRLNLYNGDSGKIEMQPTGGNVLIGTTTDAGFKLDVNGTARVSDLVHLNNVSGGQIRMWTSTANNSGIYGISSSSTGIYGNTHVQFDLFVRSTGTGTKKFGQSSLGNTNNICITNNNTLLEPIMISTTDTGGVGIMKSNSTIPLSAALEIESTTKGFLPPRMTTAQKNAIGTPATGLVLYDTTLNKLCVFTGVNWETVTSV